MMKVALVTGALGGIGLKTCEILMENGFEVVGMDIADCDAPKFTYVKGDLSQEEDRERFVKTAIEKYSRIDVLVNVAGVAPKIRADLLEMSEESYDFVMDINVKGTLFLTQLVANQMIKQGVQGCIVNISSMSAYTSSTNRGEYCISKAAVSMVTSLFADRLSEYGITVNEIRPGIIATNMTSTVKEKYDNLIFNNGILPIKRWGTPEDVAKAVLTLCDGSLSYVTGQVINVDGGFHIRRM